MKSSTEISERKLTVHVYPTKEKASHFMYYEDDGKTFSYENGEFFQCMFKTTLKADRLAITVNSEHREYQPDWKEIEFIIHGVDSTITTTINEQEQSNIDYLSEHTIRIQQNIQAIL